MRPVEPLGRPPKLDELWWGTRNKIEVDENGCWIWQGARFNNGYGPHLRLYDRYVRDRRGTGLDLHHTCGNGSGGCCNPAHLELVQRNRHRRAHRQADGKLGAENVKRIRARLRAGNETLDDLAREYGVVRNTIHKIAMGSTWLDDGVPVGIRMTYTRVCPHCGETFATDRRRRRYCTNEHARAYNNRRDVIQARKLRKDKQT